MVGCAGRRPEAQCLTRRVWESVVEALLAQLEISDALMVPFLSTMTGVSSPAAGTIGPCVLSLRIGIELDDRLNG